MLTFFVVLFSRHAYPYRCPPPVALTGSFLVVFLTLLLIVVILLETVIIGGCCIYGQTLYVSEKDNDIALLKLKTPAVLNDKVKIINLDNGSCGKVGSICKAKGWGRVHRGEYGLLTYSFFCNFRSTRSKDFFVVIYFYIQSLH